VRSPSSSPATALLIAAALAAPIPATAQAADTPPASTPTTAPAVPAESTITRVRLRIPGRPNPAEYWVRTPPGYASDQCPALIIALHGTDDTARQMVDFWGSLHTPAPVLLVAPQGVGKGWSESDLPTIQAMWADLQNRFGFDLDRVLLAGFSAGGAMTFELLYKEKLPVTAAAALANYVPPRITAADVAARRHVPVFYAVGMEDLNRERMRVGLDYLRSAGANIDLYRPRIGHTLDAGVAQKALDWFFDQCRKRLDAQIDEASKDEGLPSAIACLEAIITQARWYEPATVAKASQILDRREEQGRADLRTAEGLAATGHKVEAAELLRKISTTYRHGRLARAARAQCDPLESDPVVRNEVARRQAARRANEASTLYQSAQRLLVQNRRAEAADACETIITQYSDTPTATRARRLLELLQSRSTP
jgi:poly(3-hydroxybutyrate) depolymerase